MQKTIYVHANYIELFYTIYTKKDYENLGEFAFTSEENVSRKKST